MNFTAYIQRQKSLIRRRSEQSAAANGKRFSANAEKIPPAELREILLGELDGLAGLNKEERAMYAVCRGS